MSGSTIGGIAGAAIGFWVGGPAGAQWGYAIGSIVGGAVSPDHVQGTRLGEIQLQTSSEGVPRPIPYGSPEPFAGNLIQAGPHIRVIKETRQSSGKGGGPIVENEEVYQTYALRICEGRKTGVEVIQVWRDGKMVLDRTGRNLIDAEGIQFQTKALFYTGTDNQLPDPSLESLPVANGGGVGNVPAYRGSCYMVVVNDNLTSTGGRIPTYHFRVSANATVTTTCTDKGLIFWWPLDDAGAGGVAREVMQGANGVYGPSGIGGGPPLSAGSSASFAAGSGGYMWTPSTTYAPGFFSLQNLDEWSTSIIGQPTEVFAGTVAKSMFAYWQDVAAGYVEFIMALDDAGTNMTGRGGVGQGSGDTINVNGGSASLFFPSLYTMTWKSNTPGNPADVGTLRLFRGAAMVDQLLNQPNASRTGAFIACGGIEFPGSIDFIGYLQDAKIYNYARTPDEIAHTAAGVGPSDDFWAIPDSPGSFVNAQGVRFTPCVSSAVINGETLSSIKADLGKRCDIDAAELDLVADEDIIVDGYLVGKQMQGQAAWSDLDSAYFRDAPEYDGQIHSIPRGGATVRSFTDDDFINAPKEDRIGRRQMIELPLGVNLGYSDPAQNYARGIAPYRRQSKDVTATSVVQMEFPLVLDRAVAFQKAEIWMKQEWEAAEGKLERALPFYANADLVPSDCFTLNGRRYRLVRAETTDNVMKVEAVRDRVRNYASASVGSIPLDPTAPVSSIKGPTAFTALNLPRLYSAMNTSGIVFAGTGLLEGWPGAILYRSLDGGLSWTIVGSIDHRATMGRLVADIGASGEPMSVEIFDGRDLSSITAEQMALQMNGFAVTSSAVSEIGQFMTAQESSSGDWDLYDLVRGGLDTDAVPHFTGDDFLLLDSAIGFDRIDPSYAGREILYRPVTRGTPIENNPTYSIIFLPQFTGPETVAFYVDEANDEYVDDFGSRYQVT